MKKKFGLWLCDLGLRFLAWGEAEYGTDSKEDWEWLRRTGVEFNGEMKLDWARRAATEALIGMQNDCNAMMKLTKVERDSLLFSVAASMRDLTGLARDKEREECAQLAERVKGAAMCWAIPRSIAEAIRARGSKSPDGSVTK